MDPKLELFLKALGDCLALNQETSWLSRGSLERPGVQNCYQNHIETQIFKMVCYRYLRSLGVLSGAI